MTRSRILQHVNIMVDDLETATAFYRDVIGLDLDVTPELGFPAQFFKLGNGGQIHMNQLDDVKPERAHFCLVVDDFNVVFRRLKAAGVIDYRSWGKIRRLPAGSMQMFARDPAGNLVEIASRPTDPIDADILEDTLVLRADGSDRDVSV